MGHTLIMNDANGDNKRALLEVRDLRVAFRVPRRLGNRSGGVVQAVDGVSFDIDRGTTLGLVGESGCGKTTVGRAILRLTGAAGGQVLFDGVDVLAAPRAELGRLRREMQIVFQDTSGSLNPRLTVGWTVAEPFRLHRIARGRELGGSVAELLERVGLRAVDAGRYPHELSGGQRQRVGIARAIALRPKFIVWDEPVSALDVSIQSAILNLLRDLQREMGLTCLFISHNLAVVRHVSDRVAVMYLGRIVEISDAPDLYALPSHPYTMALMAAVPGEGGDGSRDRLVLHGDAPSPIDPPGGCVFHPRCPFVTAECRSVAPQLEHCEGLSPEHQVACHHAVAIGQGEAVEG